MTAYITSHDVYLQLGMRCYCFSSILHARESRNTAKPGISEWPVMAVLSRSYYESVSPLAGSRLIESTIINSSCSRPDRKSYSITYCSNSASSSRDALRSNVISGVYPYVKADAVCRQSAKSVLFSEYKLNAISRLGSS